MRRSHIRTESQRVSGLRRGRGYSFEHSIVQRINNAENWHARRLGGTSVSLPDVMATHVGLKAPNNPLHVPSTVLLSIEAKSGAGTELFVPQKQVQRCFDALEIFTAYQSRYVVMAFKFFSKLRTTKQVDGVRVKGYETRELREYYYTITSWMPVTDYKCKYDGKLFYKSISHGSPDYGKWVPIPLQRMGEVIFGMPFRVDGHL